MKETIKDNLILLLLGAIVGIFGAHASLTLIREHAVPAVEAEAAREASWKAFCEARGYDPEDHSQVHVDEYLDTWRGSTEEETALNHLPAIEI